MINCMRDDKKTVVCAAGDAAQVAADICEVIRSIYFEMPVKVRPLFKECVLLAVNHKDSPMWQSPPPSSERVVIRSEGGELLKQAKGAALVDRKIRGLAWITLRWAAEVRPRVIILENVAADYGARCLRVRREGEKVIAFEIPYPPTKKGKAVVDAMKGYLLPDDDSRWFRRVTHEFWPGDCIRVEVVEL